MANARPALPHFGGGGMKMGVVVGAAVVVVLDVDTKVVVTAGVDEDVVWIGEEDTEVAVEELAVKLLVEGADDTLVDVAAVEEVNFALVLVVMIAGGVCTSTVPGIIPDGSAIVNVIGAVIVPVPVYGTVMVTKGPRVELVVLITIAVEDEVNCPVEEVVMSVLVVLCCAV